MTDIPDNMIEIALEAMRRESAAWDCTACADGKWLVRPVGNNGQADLPKGMINQTQRVDRYFADLPSAQAWIGWEIAHAMLRAYESAKFRRRILS